jgi:hypothetical protein
VVVQAMLQKACSKSLRARRQTMNLEEFDLSEEGAGEIMSQSLEELERILDDLFLNSRKFADPNLQKLNDMMEKVYLDMRRRVRSKRQARQPSLFD